MLGLHSRLRRNEEEVAAKVMDGEAIIINLSNGCYYSMERTGGAIWGMVEAGYSLDEMVEDLLRRYDVAARKRKPTCNAWRRNCCRKVWSRWRMASCPAAAASGHSAAVAL